MRRNARLVLGWCCLSLLPSLTLGGCEDDPMDDDYLDAVDAAAGTGGAAGAGTGGGAGSDAAAADSGNTLDDAGDTDSGEADAG